MKITLEKVVSWIAVIGFVAAVVWAYANLNNRLDNMGNEMAGIKDSLGSTACNAILPRQIEAIEKNHKDALKALQGLSQQYDCGPHQTEMPSPLDSNWANAVQNTSAATARTEQNAAELNAELNEIDRKLSENPFNNASR